MGDGDCQWASILFIDGGQGMGRAAISRVFDPFFTTKPPGEGTGLGLAVAQSVVERHGGRIELVSEPGLGTLVAIRLPLDGPGR
ncbi:MAG: HAMP domain-containing histidine kinase [Verrucomicrobiae bacterium]|nr:HAMP domain-containing histidine kinase [Verrucomicrobiae bacterium]